MHEFSVHQSIVPSFRTQFELVYCWSCRQYRWITVHTKFAQFGIECTRGQMCMYSGVQLKSKFPQHTATWSAAAWPPPRLCVIAQQYSSATFASLCFHMRKEKIGEGRVLKMLPFQFLKLLLHLSVYLSIYPLTYPIYLPVYPIYLSIYPSVYPIYPSSYPTI